MSRGQASRTVLPDLASMDDKRRWKEINRWADKLALNMIGFIANGADSIQTFNNATKTAMQWTTTDYESDKFFVYNSSGYADNAVIPDSMGGMYGYSVNMMHDGPTGTLQAVFYIRVTPRRTGTAFIASRTVIKDWIANQTYNVSGTIPYILSPGDKVEFVLNQTSGSNQTFLGSTATTEYPQRPHFCFFRIDHADLT
jgi:hypothetical protein